MIQLTKMAKEIRIKILFGLLIISDESIQNDDDDGGDENDFPN